LGFVCKKTPADKLEFLSDEEITALLDLRAALGAIGGAISMPRWVKQIQRSLEIPE